jgi:hypothetical protein
MVPQPPGATSSRALKVLRHLRRGRARTGPIVDARLERHDAECTALASAYARRTRICDRTTQRLSSATDTSRCLNARRADGIPNKQARRYERWEGLPVREERREVHLRW